MANADVDSTIAALKGGLTSIPAETAVAVIDSWKQQLQGNPIAQDLDKLKQALTSGDKAAISKTLAEVGKNTTQAAGSASGDAATKIKQLGELLSQAGSSLN